MKVYLTNGSSTGRSDFDLSKSIPKTNHRLRGKVKNIFVKFYVHHTLKNRVESFFWVDKKTIHIFCSTFWICIFWIVFFRNFHFSRCRNVTAISPSRASNLMFNESVNLGKRELTIRVKKIIPFQLISRVSKQQYFQLFWKIRGTKRKIQEYQKSFHQTNRCLQCQ